MPEAPASAQLDAKEATKMDSKLRDLVELAGAAGATVIHENDKLRWRIPGRPEIISPYRISEGRSFENLKAKLRRDLGLPIPHKNGVQTVVEEEQVAMTQPETKPENLSELLLRAATLADDLIRRNGELHDRLTAMANTVANVEEEARRAAMAAVEKMLQERKLG